MSAIQIPPLIIDYGSLPLIILGWTILCGVLYWIIRNRSNDDKSLDDGTLLKLCISIFILWAIPTLILMTAIDFIILRSLNPISLLLAIQFIIIFLDIRKVYLLKK